MFALSLASECTSALVQTAAETIDLPRQPIFRTNFASDSILESYKVQGRVPDRKTWNLHDAQERLGHLDKGTFGLRAVENRDWRLARSDTKKRNKGIDPFAPEGPSISDARASVSTSRKSYADSLKDTTTLKRADKYYQALLKAEKVRKENWRREEWEEFLDKANRSAAKSRKAVLKAEKIAEQGKNTFGSDSESEKESEDDDEESDPGDLKPYPGVMKVEVEVVVLRPPRPPGHAGKGEGSDSESSVGDEETHTPSGASDEDASDEEDAHGIDWDAELQALQEELGVDDKGEAESETESIPDGLFGQKIGNVHDSNEKRTALGLGGTAFFVPEVERYAFAPSLLPPPPRGEGYVVQTGHKRLKLKPRLPLEVSRHRWRDEHPYGCPIEAEYTPDVDDVREWEEKVRRVELYGTLTKLITTMPKPDGIRKLPATDDFEKSLDRELGESQAWKQYIKRQRLLEVARAARGDEPKPAGPGEGLLEGYKPGLPAGTQASKAKDNKSSKGSSSSKPVVPPIPLHPGAVAPLKMLGPPAFQVGKMIQSKSSPPRSPKGTRARGLMSVAGQVRKGADFGRTF